LPSRINILNSISANSRYFFNLCSTFLSQIVSALSVLILTPILLSKLGAADFSIYGVLLNLVVFSGIFDFGFNIGLLKKLISKDSSAEQLISTLLSFFFLLFLFGFPILYLLFSKDIFKLGENYLFYAFLTACLIVQNIIAVLFDVVIQSANKIFVGKIIRVIKVSLEFVLILILCNYHSIVLLLSASLLVNCLYILLLWLNAKKVVPFVFDINDFSLVLLSKHFVFSFWYFLSSVAGMLVFNSQVILMNFFVGAEGVAKYLIITRFYDIIRIGLSNFTIVLFPTLAKIQAEGNWVLLKSFFYKSLLRVSIFAILVFFLTLFIAKPFFLNWSKYSDTEMNTLFIVFSIFILFIVIENVAATFISALKLNRLPTIVAIFQGILGLLLGYFLLMKYGIIGMAIASLIALISTNFIFNPWYLVKKMNEHIKLKSTI